MRRAAAILALLVSAAAAQAGLTVSSLTGRVTAGDAPAAGATVTVTARAFPFTRTVTADRHGRYWFPSLQPGTYDVTFSGTGWSSLSRPVSIELGRVARADARLEASEDEETVTSTASTHSITDTTPITARFHGEQLDRLPFGRAGATMLTAGPPIAESSLDDAAFDPALLGEEVIAEWTLFRGAAPVEFARVPTLSMRSPLPANELSLALRGSFALTRPRNAFFEAAGGRGIVADRAWLFASVWGGDTTRMRDVRGFAVKTAAQAGAAHHLEGAMFGVDAEAGGQTTAGVLRYSGAFGSTFTADANVTDEGGTAVAAFARGSHVTRAGLGTDDRSDRDAFFAAHRWSSERVALDLGARHSGGTTMPRLAATFDVRGNGRQALAASHGEYEDGAKITTFGFVTAVGASGAIRADVVRREGHGLRVDQLQAEGQYRLFDRLEAGGAYTWTDLERPALPLPLQRHRGAAWLGVRIALGERELATTGVRRYEAGRWLTDAAIRYSLPLSRTVLTLAVDATDLLDERTVRIWTRIGL
jgi:hypothetical protein